MFIFTNDACKKELYEEFNVGAFFERSEMTASDLDYLLTENLVYDADDKEKFEEDYRYEKCEKCNKIIAFDEFDDNDGLCDGCNGAAKIK